MLRPRDITDILFSHEWEGYSVDVNNNTPFEGYMVGGEVPSLVLPVNDLFPITTTDAWLAEHWDFLSLPGYYAGIWLDTKTLVTYIDISRNVVDIHTAVALAETRGELAVWDVLGQREVRING